MRILHGVLAALAIAFVVLVVGANRECAPKYFQRGDVIALLFLAIAFALLLLWASADDDDRRRGVGAVSSAGLAALFLSTASIPVLVSPLAIAGAFRVPRSRVARWRVLALMPLAIVATIGLLYLGQSGITPDQFRCP